MKNKKLVKTVLRIVVLSCVAIFFGCNIYLWNAQSLTGNAMPMPFGYGTALVLSGSMEPELSIDDLIFVKEQDHYEVGDVVVFQDGSILVVHRILEINGETVITKGDANNADDGEMEISRIKGKVIGSVGNAGAVVRILKSPLVSIGLLAGAVFLLERSYRKEKEKGDNELDQLKAEIRKLKEEAEKDLQ